MGSHIIQHFLNNSKKFAGKEVFRYKDQLNQYQSITWDSLKETVDKVVSAFHVLGLEKGSIVGIFSQNKAEWLTTDLGIMALGGIAVPFYATSSASQLKYIINETRMKVLFVGNEDQLKLTLELMNEGFPLEKVICFEETNIKDQRVISFPDFLQMPLEKGISIKAEDRVSEYSEEDLATIIYTSGTTGEPKGVMLLQKSFLHCFHIHDQRLDVRSSDVSLCFLPLSHVFERMWSHYLLYKGAVNVFLDNPREVIETLPRVKPTVMCAVPRFFEKTYDGIQAETKKWSPIKTKIFNWSVKQGFKTLPYKSVNKNLPVGLAFKVAIADKLVLSKLRSIFGGSIRYMPCAGAAISTDILKFFHAIGLFINFGYGATETTATVSCFRDDKYTFGTCGTVMPGIEVKIGENSEILVKGNTVFSGYYKKEDQTAEVLKDGWFYTGDEGYLDENNSLIMVDRIKDLMKTSVGKYVSPQKLEMILSQDALVEQLIVVGDNRQYVSALIVPAMDNLKQLAREHNISFQDEKDLVNSEMINDILRKRFENLQTDLMPHEKVVKFVLLPEPFSIEAGTMTNTLKLRRSSIEKIYKHLVDKLYES
jgi:long-chain acyl-CoA synthetase